MDPFVDSHDHHNYGSSGDSSDLNTTELPASVPRYSSTGSRSPRYMAVSSPFMDPPMIPANSVTQPSALAHQRKHSRTSSVARGPIAATAVVGATTSTVVPESPLRQATSHSNNSLGERDNSPPLTLMDARSIPVPSTPPNYTGYQNGHHDTNVTPTGGNNGSVMTNTATASGTPPPSVAKPHKRRYIGDWDFVKTIGAGSMGQVKLAKNRVNSDLCAVKVVPRSHVDHHRSRHDKKDSDISKDIRTIREAAIGKLVNHKYICKMLEVYPMTNHIYLLFEYVSGGQMLDYIISHGSLKEKQARKFARSIASALDYLHRNSIVHRAPELLNAQPYIGPEVDIWSFGIVLYVLVCGKVPFDDQSMPALHAKIKEGKVEYPSWLSSDCCDILRRMLVVDSKNRASLEEIKHHPWLTKGYDKPPESYVPHRTPLQGPLDPAVINEMSGFDFGSPEEIHTHLRTILESLEYQSAVNNWFKLNGESEKRSRHFSLDFYRRRVSISQELKSYPDPTNAYHPLISIYYLVREKQLRERERIADLEREASALALVDNNNSNYSNNNNNNNSSGHHLLPHRHHSQSSSNNTSLHSNRASIEAPVLPVPETAHTQHDGPSSIQNLGMKNDGMRIRAKTQGASDYPATSIPYSPPTRRRSRHQAHASEPPLISIETSVNYSNDNTQQQNSGIAGSILRRFSTRKKQSDVPRPTPTIITNTTYEPTEPTESSACNGQDMFSGNIRRKATVSGTTPSSFHPTARAKSLGHVRRKSTLRYYRDAAGNDTAPQPSTYNDESFDEIALIDEISHNVGNDMDGEMLSIQYPKQVFLKGFFSVQSTSTKSLAFIRSDIIRVLTHLGISYREIRGGFLCVHKPSIKIEEEAMQAFSPPQSPHMVTTPQQGHWRKLSFGSGIFGARRRSISIIHGQGSSSESYNTSDVSAESVGGNSGGNGGSDMLGFNSQESSGIRTPLKFELYIVKVPLLMSLHGVQFKKLAGNSWQYKSLATKILSELRL